MAAFVLDRYLGWVVGAALIALLALPVLVARMDKRRAKSGEREVGK